jgi:hypothetical protein
MNKRVEELAKFNERIQNFYQTGPVQRAAIEEFAELIIKECVTAVLEKGKTYAIPSAGEAQSGWFAKAIKRHFGVE